MTKDNLVAGAIATGVAVAIAFVISVIREVGLLNILKVLSASIGSLCVMFALYWIGYRLQYVFTIIPLFAQALIVVMLQFLGAIALCAVGAYTYTRWRATGEIVEPLSTVIPILV